MKSPLSMAAVVLTAACLLALPVPRRAPKVKVPEPGVPQIMTMEGKYVRVAYNNEGYAILGYKLANTVVGENGCSSRSASPCATGCPNYEMTREALSLETPDGKTIPLPTIEEFRKADTRALNKRAKVQRDSINYFPPNAQPGVPHRLLHRPRQPRDAVGQGRAELPAARASAASTSRCPAGSSTASTGST